MTYTITKSFEFSAAHRVEGHPKCGRMHGHNYKVTVALNAEHLPDDGMVIDYAEVKELVKPLIDLLDHRYIVSHSNQQAKCPYLAHAPKEDVVILALPASTAENLAQWFHTTLYPKVQARWPEVTLAWISVSETPSTEAVYG